MRVHEGDLVLMYIDDRRKKLIKVKRGLTFSSDKGFVAHDELIGVEYGSPVRLSTGVRAYVLRPTLDDILRAFKRRTQVIYPKDLGLMIMKLGVGYGKRCLEGGIGSGYVAATLSWMGCKTASFEVRDEHLHVAKRNLEEFGLDDNIVFVKDSLKNAPNVFGKEVFDLAIIDVGDPWNVVKEVWEVLKGGAPVAFWLPTTNQLEKLKQATEGYFIWQEALEVSERRMRVKVGVTRPEQIGITFTGYLVILRKIVNAL